MAQDKIVNFDKKIIRKELVKEEWFYSIIDIIELLEVSSKSNRYWSELKNKLEGEGFELFDKIEQLKFKARDGKFYGTDCVNRKTVFRLIQSIPSKKVEVFKRWFAQVAEQRINDIENYKLMGYSDSWIKRRIFSKEKRDELTNEWKKRGIEKSRDFAFLSHIIHKGTFDKSVSEHKKYKILPKKEELRNHMTDIELALISLSEATTSQITKKKNSKGYPKLSKDASRGAKIGKRARLDIEKELGESIVSSENHLDKQNKLHK